MKTSKFPSLRSQVLFLEDLPGIKKISLVLGFEPEQIVVIYDKKLYAHPNVKAWLKKFPLSYGVRAGEKLKDIDYFPLHLKKIMKVMGPSAPQNMCFVSLGGGSLGDFVGFLASIFKRGVPLIHIPTTFLAAMDSAHGGKTALNVGTVKNQVGSFYPATAVLIIQSLLQTLSKKQLQSAAGELMKMGLIKGGELGSALQGQSKEELKWLWDFLPQAIEAKYEVVERDPFETQGERQWLNLGHSLGHILEAHYGLAHGTAVAHGLVFSIQWSFHRGYLKAQDTEDMLHLVREGTGISSPEEFFRQNKKMSLKQMSKYLNQDKKRIDRSHLSFVFLSGWGRPMRRKVTQESFFTEARRQGWISF